MIDKVNEKNPPYLKSCKAEILSKLFVQHVDLI